jgi:hypothetical protein
MKRTSYAFVLILLCSLAAYAEDFSDIGKQLKNERDAKEQNLREESVRRIKMQDEAKARMERNRKARFSSGSSAEGVAAANAGKKNGMVKRKALFCADTFVVYRGPYGEMDDYTCEADCMVSACTAQELIESGWIIKLATPKETIIRNNAVEWKGKPKYIGCKCTGSEYILER